jgi:GntR family transcriptional repressor for pyruvate dehydrogenase complex
VTFDGELPGSAIGPVVVPKASDVLANHLREQILNGQLAEGSALPVERELAATVGLSRGTVRDALRVLEIEGLITTRPGRAGGSFVRRPDATTLQRSLNALVSGRGVRFRSLLETRDALEPAAAELAAAHRTEEDLARLEELSEQLRDSIPDIPRFLALNVDWHVAIVTASHNEIMQIILDSLSRAILSATDISEFNTAQTMTDTLTAHDRILSAIRKQDPQKALSAMSKHVHGYRVLIESYELPEQLSI